MAASEGTTATGSQHRPHAEKSVSLLVRIFLPFAAGYFLSFFYRSINAVIGGDLAAEMSLTPTSLGLMTSAYFFAFALFQIPLGVLLDRFGARRVQGSLVAVSACGAVLFAFGETLAVLTLGRALIGLGMAGGLMAAITTFAQWFPAERLPWLNGCFLAFGGLGALAATVPVEAALEIMSWRSLFLWLGLLTLLVSGAIFLAVPEPERVQEEGGAEGVWHLFHGLSDILGSRVFWSIAPLSFACLSSAFAVQGLWAGPWLQEVAGFSSGTAAAHLMIVAAGLTLGSLLSGSIVNLMARARVGILGTYAFCGAAFIAIQMVIVIFPDRLTWTLWFAFGLLINQAALAYAILASYFPKGTLGRVNTCLNLFVGGGAFVVQYAMGWIVDLVFALAGPDAAAIAYRSSFTAAILFQVAGLAVLLVQFRRTRSALG